MDVVKFYETIFSSQAEGDNIHSFIKAAGLSIAIYDKSHAEAVMGFDFSNTGTGLITIGFDVDNVDAEYERIKALNVINVTEPQVWPWGAKSFRFKDIEGNFIVSAVFQSNCLGLWLCRPVRGRRCSEKLGETKRKISAVHARI